MATTLTQFQKKMMARRGSSNLDRLARQYQENIKNITGEYESSFADYTKSKSEQMSAYETESAKYKTALDEYTKNVADPYKAALNKYTQDATSYQDLLAQYSSGAKDIVGTSNKQLIKKNGQAYYDYWYDFGGKRVEYDATQNPEKYGFQYIMTPVELGRRGENYYVARPLMPEKEPVAPTAPEKFSMEAPKAPDIQEFDTSAFEAKKAEAEQQFNREKGEIKGARLAAVSRKQRRPLLQGVKA